LDRSINISRSKSTVKVLEKKDKELNKSIKEDKENAVSNNY